MHIVISAGGAESGRDLAQLQDWLRSAGEAPWQLPPLAPEVGDDLGIGIDEISAIVTAAAELPALIDRIREWFPTRHAPEPVRIVITLDPADPEVAGEPAPRPDEQLA
jgi:hypothetical protein